MGRNRFKSAELSEICPKFSVAPIEDDDSYRAAIEILDRLFEGDDPRTPDEVEFFRWLARMASEYEMTASSITPTPTRTGRSPDPS
jgi:antitoxin component HigA of HigAB toxin-antitoxin module